MKEKKVKYHDNGKFSENDYYQKKLVKHTMEMKEGCFPLCFIALLLVIILFCVTKCDKNKYDYNDPKAVIKRERISETDSTETWRTVTYRVVKVRVDTLRKDRTPRSTLDVAPKARVEFPK